MFPFSAIVLIGMSGVGKTHWASIYRDEGGRSLSADEQIANKLLPQMREAGIAEDGEKIDRLAAFVGKFGAEKHGGLARGEFFRRQEIYLDAELQGLMDFWTKIDGLELPMLYDTTGSFCELFPKYTSGVGTFHDIAEDFCGLRKERPCKERECIVYLACGQEEKKTLLDRQLERPKPMVYDREFFEACLSDYQSGKSGGEEEIVPDDFLRFVFPKAIEHRSARYEKLARVIVTTAELESVRRENNSSTFAEAFVALVENKLSSSRAQQGRGLELA